MAQARPARRRSNARPAIAHGRPLALNTLDPTRIDTTRTATQIRLRRPDGGQLQVLTPAASRFQGGRRRATVAPAPRLTLNRVRTECEPCRVRACSAKFAGTAAKAGQHRRKKALPAGV